MTSNEKSIDLSVDGPNRGLCNECDDEFFAVELASPAGGVSFPGEAPPQGGREGPPVADE